MDIYVEKKKHRKKNIMYIKLNVVIYYIDDCE